MFVVCFLILIKSLQGYDLTSCLISFPLILIGCDGQMVFEKQKKKGEKNINQIL